MDLEAHISKGLPLCLIIFSTNVIEYMNVIQ